MIKICLEIRIVMWIITATLHVFLFISGHCVGGSPCIFSKHILFKCLFYFLYQFFIKIITPSYSYPQFTTWENCLFSSQINVKFFTLTLQNFVRVHHFCFLGKEILTTLDILHKRKGGQNFTLNLLNTKALTKNTSVSKGCRNWVQIASRLEERSYVLYVNIC